MLKFMKKIPGELLLIPMLISAIINTFAPGFFANFGSITEAVFTEQSTNTIIGIVSLCASTQLDLKSIPSVLKKQGTLLLAKMILTIVLGFAFMKYFGLEGIWGISAVAFIPAMASLNPSLYLALVSDYGVEEDKAAFGLVGLLAVPAFPLFVFNITQGGAIDWLPIISALIPTLVGVVIRNLDKELGNLLNSIVSGLLIFMGWSLGAGINIMDAFKAGPQGVLLTIVFYIIMFPSIYLIETKGLNENGISSLAISSIAGLSISVPSIIASHNPDIAPMVSMAASQIAFGTTITSIITPYITEKIAQAKGISKNK